MLKDGIKDSLQEGIAIHNEQERETVLNSLGILTAKQRSNRIAVIVFGLFFVIFFSLVYILCTNSDVLIPLIRQGLRELCQLENVITVILGVGFLTFL